MTKAFKLLIALFISNFCQAQNQDSAHWNRFKNLFDNPYKKHESVRILGIHSSMMLSANHLSNSFIYPFVFGKTLEKATINTALNLSKNKQLTIESHHELRYVNLQKKLFHKTNLHGYIKGGNYSRTYLNATNDAAILIFKGNAGASSFKFDQCNYSALNLNKIGVGLYSHREKTARPYNLSFGLFIMQTLNYQNINTFDNNFLRGNEDSFDIAVNYEALFARADPFSSNGMGLGSEFSFNQKINKTCVWGVKVENFGFASFSKTASTYSGKGQYKFDGIWISEIGRINEGHYIKNELDSFINPLANKKENQSRTLWIAPSSSCYFGINLKQNYYQIALRHSGTKSMPVAELRYFRFLKPALLFGVSAATLGQTYVNTDINWAINKQWLFQAAIYHIESLVLPKTFGGLGGAFGLHFIF